MSLFSPNRWYTPKTTDEAVKIIEEHPGEALLFGGGTYIHELRERGSLEWVKACVDLQAIGLNYLEKTQDGIKVGAMATLNDVISCAGFRAGGFESLIQAAYAMGPEQIKNAATLGGAVGCRVPIIDVVPALISLGAKVMLRVAGETRVIGLEELLNGPEASLLGRTAVIVEFLVPQPAPGSRSHFRKFRRSAADWPIVNASVLVRVDSARDCADARLVVGSRPEGYFRLKKSEEFLVGKQINGDTLEALPHVVSSEVRLENHFTASAEYKKALAGTFVREAVQRAVEAEPS
ncbi:MAG: FAD binding domain-containing protein [Deltaproteobacteria bacterium]|nr:FAD binding domain-containing protein [Deltaproteobacteria bacterium]